MTSKGKGREVGRVPHGTDYLEHSSSYVHFRRPIRQTSKGNWVYIGGPDSGKIVDAPLVAWEDRKALLRMVTSPVKTIPLTPIDIPKEDIKEGIIPKGAITPINEEDPEPPQTLLRLRNPRKVQATLENQTQPQIQPQLQS